ncbi:S-adenosyl-L-methionine-dependent methyltransferase [Scenedesmus sp. NREL 46B-D3]|nr:S-adenosyl-L-methionine-dependent methyltransferase [Scenedesmus sp. NREL 46B-D3]
MSLSSDSEDEQLQTGQQDEEWEEWDGDDEEEDATRSLFCDVVLPTPEAAFAYDATHYGFDIRQFRIERRLDDYDTIRVINFIRREVAAGRDPLPALVASGQQQEESGKPWAGDEYLNPTLPDDPLITYDYEEQQQLELELGQLGITRCGGRGSCQQLLVRAAADDAAAAPGPSSSSRRAPHAAVNAGAAAAAVDTQYYDSYSGFDIHQEMLSDKPRSGAYRDALGRNPGLLRGARLLDVGCGSSILCLFGARGGAASVVGLDGSARIADCARQVVAANKLDAAAGGPVSIIAGRVEEVAGIGHDKVDVIVSEWMGYALLFECMLDSVLAARDRWLAPRGALLPDLASISVAGASRGAFGTGFWQDVYGFSMQPIADELAAAAAREAQVVVRPVEPDCLTTPALQVHAMDLATMSPAQQDFTAHFTLSATSAQLVSSCEAGDTSGETTNSSSSTSSETVEVAALVLWFDVEFSARFCKEHPVTLSTSPHAPVTHWAQALLPLAAPVMLGPGQALRCRLSMARSRARHRSLDISLEYSGPGGQTAARIYNMEVSSSSAGGSNK